MKKFDNVAIIELETGEPILDQDGSEVALVTIALRVIKTSIGSGQDVVEVLSLGNKFRKFKGNEEIYLEDAELKLLEILMDAQKVYMDYIAGQVKLALKNATEHSIQ